MKILLFIFFSLISNLLYGQHIIRNLQWLNADHEITELTLGYGVTLYAETDNIENNDIVTITIWEKGDETDYLVGKYISRIIDNKIFFHWIIVYEKETSENDLYRNGFTVQYYFNVQYDKIISHNSELLDVLSWIKTRFVYQGTNIPIANRKYSIVLPDNTEIEGWTDAEGYMRNENMRIWGRKYYYLHEESEDDHAVEPAHQEPGSPVYYQVKENDSLWKIASYDFVYGNPYLWKHLYEANKHNFIDEKNPNLIEAGQALVIPQLGDNLRNGTR